ncbi:hypothetical protein TwortDSMZ_200 [Staphylococcus phage Twort]|uniref:Uncharacterized protein n=2 Tax=Staphylococcus phage Twort (strain DSM 17442 / HER 48) TaxID=2908167 RepID=A0A6H0X543_BPTWO|nr:membrane protein [Staphylococcus phage Twort]AAX92446.1 ORF175 [Staphylococcus phage Twort]QIW89023.1 hypothetical protein TwortDSMZ_011 [Staphylococcus phage Twort]QIW89194.1 hypothetical protein TwortDSMZ_200 [Staphylococcus phage Twort]
MSSYVHHVPVVTPHNDGGASTVDSSNGNHTVDHKEQWEPGMSEQEAMYTVFGIALFIMIVVLVFIIVVKLKR